MAWKSLVFFPSYIPKFDDQITVLAIFDLCRIGCGAAGSGRTAGEDEREDGSDQEPMAPRGNRVCLPMIQGLKYGRYPLVN
jgi:hypothetical protein